ncbi:integral membrane protein [Colletotrichum tofieldiae]|uniref:Integral membrane protein n=1 Tax=Colletotrichum tofieldiae TaxID=708197 RepID=A0A166U6F1_9PEZI|nr:integral membrane protein [Colletotrichum tofieldiae]
MSHMTQELCRPFPQESRDFEIKLVVTVFAAITYPIVALRLLSRWIATNRLQYDDWITIATALYYAIQILYVAIIVLAKLAIVAFFARIFLDRKFQVANQIVFTVLVCHGVIFVFLIMFECSPVASIWDRTLDGQCIDLNAVTLASAILSIVEDFVILAMPIQQLKKLQLTRKKKMAVGLMFSLGSFTCITSMVRLRWLSMFVDPYDMTWDRVDLVTWSVAEISCALLCGSLPALRPLFKKIPNLVAIIRGTHPSADIEEPLDIYKGSSRMTFQNQGHGLISMPQLYTPRTPPPKESADVDFHSVRNDIERQVDSQSERLSSLMQPLNSHPPWRNRDSQSTTSTTYMSPRSPITMLSVKDYEMNSRSTVAPNYSKTRR